MKKQKTRIKIKYNAFKFTCLVIGILLIFMGFTILIKSKYEQSILKGNNSNLKISIDDNTFSSTLENIQSKEIPAVFFNDFSMAVAKAKYYPTNFIGKLTHYGPDCKGCGGHVACTGQDVRNGNIYYNDKEYGKIRIVAADKSIPCGSIIRINIKEYNYMYTIVLDRGGIIKGARIDLLKETGITESPVRTVNNASFDIIRMGYVK